MLKNNSIAMVASFATIKGMLEGEGYKSPYQILAEFIQDTIIEKNLLVFTSSEIKSQLSDLFGFDLPEAVIKTSIKNLKYIKKNRGIYQVDNCEEGANTKFKEIKSASEDDFLEVFNQLRNYVQERKPFEKVEDDLLTKEFLAFLVDDNKRISGEKYVSLIGEFVLKFEKNEDIQRTLKTIREGSIIYIGLNYNINNVGNLKKDLTLYLATEVLFSISGLNGDIHKQLAQDFYSQIKEINGKKKRIRLRFFSEVKKEIENYFSTARLIIERKRKLEPDSVAMKNILRDCHTPSDVDVKEADFFEILKKDYEITEDDRADYYSESEYYYNLEEMQTQTNYKEDSLKMISHINKLRKGEIFSNYLEAEHLIITNSSNTLTLSKEKVSELTVSGSGSNVCDYAISVDYITNILWYQLGNVFGKKEFPKNVNVALKARTFLSSQVIKHVSKVYEATARDFKSGKISKEILDARIAYLLRKQLLPEELNADTIEEDLDFSYGNMLNLEEKIARNEELIVKYEKDIETANEEKRSLEKELRYFKEKDIQGKRIKRKIIVFVIIVVIIILFISLIIGLSVVLKRVNPLLITSISLVLAFVGIIPRKRYIIDYVKKYLENSESLNWKNEQFDHKE